jgi:hypothetical protein
MLQISTNQEGNELAKKDVSVDSSCRSAVKGAV